MRWIVFIFRMLFTKREPVDDDDVYIQANQKRRGFTVPADLPPIEGPSIFARIPGEIIANIASELDFDDVVTLRQSCHRMNNIYFEFRNQIKGPEIHVFVNIENGEVVTTYRGHKQYRGETRLVPRSERNLIFRNADVTLTLRLGENRITSDSALEILETFKRSAIQRLQLRAESVSRETRDLINSLRSPNVELNIGRYDENVPEVHNMTDLRIRQQLPFFHLVTIFRLHLTSMSVSVTAASLPLIMECIEEWRENRRDINSWFFKIPLVEIIQDWENAEIDWRQSITQRLDGSARLRMTRRNEPLEAGELVNYQTVSWFLS